MPEFAGALIEAHLMEFPSEKINEILFLIIEQYRARITELETMVEFAPGGTGYETAKKDFEDHATK